MENRGESKRRRKRRRRKTNNRQRKRWIQCQRAVERHQQQARQRVLDEERDGVKVRSCEAKSNAKSHTDCTYSKCEKVAENT